MLEKFQIRKFNKSSRNQLPEEIQNKILGDKFLSYVYKYILDAQLKVFNSNQNVVRDTSVFLEIGSAGGITKFLRNEIITSDIRECSGVDLHLDGSSRFPFNDSSIDLILGKDVLHHLQDIEFHFSELERMLKPNGMAIYAEPNWNVISSLILTFFHPEPFLKGQKMWRFSHTNPMYSNQALPYVVFERDFQRFSNLYPSLSVNINLVPLNGLAFLFSGGVFRRTVLPSKFLIFLYNLEARCDYWMKFFGLTRLIVITKKIDH